MRRLPHLLLAGLLTAAAPAAQDDRPYLAIHARSQAVAELLGDWTGELEEEPGEGSFSLFSLGGSGQRIDWSPTTDALVAEVFVDPAGLRDGICDDLGIAAGLLRGTWCTGPVQGGAPPRYCAQVFARVWSFPEQIDEVRFTLTTAGEGGDYHVSGTITPSSGSPLERWLAGVEPDPRGTLWLRDPEATLWLGAALRGPSIQSAWQGWWQHLATMRARQLRGTEASRVEEAVGLAGALRDGRLALQWSTADRSVFAVGSHDAEALAELEQDPGFRALAQARLGEGPRAWEAVRIEEQQAVTRVEDDDLPVDRALLRTVRGDYLIEAVDEPRAPGTAKLLTRLAAGRARSVPLPAGLWLQAEFSRPPLEDLRELEFPFPLPIEIGVDDLAETVHGMLPERATLAVRRAAADSQVLRFEMDVYGF